MPIYEYHCRACGQASEILQKISEPDVKKCPLCGKPALTRQVSAAGFRLKGSGWYETDFKSGNKKNLVGDSADAGGDKPATPAAAESKPAAKSKGKDKVKKKAAAAAE